MAQPGTSTTNVEDDDGLVGLVPLQQWMVKSKFSAAAQRSIIAADLSVGELVALALENDADTITNIIDSLELNGLDKFRFSSAVKKLKPKPKPDAPSTSSASSVLIFVSSEETEAFKKLTTIHEKITNGRDSVSKSIESIEKGHATESSNIAKTFERLRKALNKKEIELRKSVEETKVKKIALLTSQEQRLKRYEEFLQKAKESYESTLRDQSLSKDVRWSKNKQILKAAVDTNGPLYYAAVEPLAQMQMIAGLDVLCGSIEKDIEKIKSLPLTQSVQSNADAYSTRMEQRKAIQKGGFHQLVVGDEWYALSKKWYDNWKRYTFFGKRDDEVTDAERKLQRPGRIDNSDLCDEKDQKQLKVDTKEHVNYEWVHSSQWKLFHLWYGGGPVVLRKVFKEATSAKTYVCAYPQWVNIAFYDKENTGPITKKQSAVLGFPTDFTFKLMAKYFERELKLEVHIWQKFKEIKEIYVAEKVTLDDLKNENGERWVEMPDDSLTRRLSDMKDVNSLVLIDKKEKDGTWPRAKSAEEWKYFQVGDIIDVVQIYTAPKTYYNSGGPKSCWRQAVILKVDVTGHIVHIVHPVDKKVDTILPANSGHIARRNTHTRE